MAADWYLCEWPILSRIGCFGVDAAAAAVAADDDDDSPAIVRKCKNTTRIGNLSMFIFIFFFFQFLMFWECLETDNGH